MMGGKEVDCQYFADDVMTLAKSGKKKLEVSERMYKLELLFLKKQ